MESSFFKSFLCLEQQLMCYFQITVSAKSTEQLPVDTAVATTLNQLHPQWCTNDVDSFFKFVILLSQIWNTLYIRDCIYRNKKSWIKKVYYSKPNVTLARWVLIHFVKVLFCTNSCSSKGGKINVIKTCWISFDLHDGIIFSTDNKYVLH